MWNDADEPRAGIVPDPPVSEWERQEALRELTRVAKSLQFEDAESVTRRLGRLTGSQRTAIAEAMERILEIGS